MVIKMRECGNSYTLTVPKEAAKKLNWHPGEMLEMRIKGNACEYRPAGGAKTLPTIREILATYPKDGVDFAWRDVQDVGREIVEFDEKVFTRKRRSCLG